MSDGMVPCRGVLCLDGPICKVTEERAARWAWCRFCVMAAWVREIPRWMVRR